MLLLCLWLTVAQAVEGTLQVKPHYTRQVFLPCLVKCPSEPRPLSAASRWAGAEMLAGGEGQQSTETPVCLCRFLQESQLLKKQLLAKADRYLVCNTQGNYTWLTHPSLPSSCGELQQWLLTITSKSVPWILSCWFYSFVHNLNNWSHWLALSFLRWLWDVE